jgi:hypothetical protein
MKHLRVALVMLVALGSGCGGGTTSKQPPSGDGGSGGDAIGGDGGSGGNGGAPVAGKGGTGGSSGSGGMGGVGGTGAVGGSGGSSNGGAGGGANPPDAAPTSPPDAAPTSSPDAGVSVADGAAPSDDGGLAPLMECTKPSLDRIESWNATGEGSTKPMSGSLLVKMGDHYVATEEFVGSGWHVLETWPGNSYDVMSDFTSSSGFWLTYSSTADLWVQMRAGGSHYSGGEQWVTPIPSTNGQMKRAFFSFDTSKWSWLTALGNMPKLSYPDTRKIVTGMLFVGDKPNKITFYEFRFDNFTPPCR